MFQTMNICVRFHTQIHSNKQSVVGYLSFLYELCQHSNEYPQVQKHATSSCSTTITTPNYQKQCYVIVDRR